MVQTLTYTKTNKLAKLHEELLAALPALQGESAPGHPLLRVGGLGDQIRIEVPDDVDGAAVAAIVAAHDASALTAAETLKSQIDSLATSAVGVRLDQLTAQQVRALAAQLLLKAGAVANDMTVRPLPEWT